MIKIFFNKLYISNFWLLKTIITILCGYLIIGTGLHGDDYSVIKQWTLASFLIITPQNLGLKIFGVPDYLTFWWAYPVFGFQYQLLYDCLKWISHLASILMSWKFFTIFFNTHRSLAASIFFIFLPLHESTTYWYMVTAYIFWPSLIMLSFYFIAKDKKITGFLVGFIGAFSFYISPPYVFGLSIIFLIRKEYNKFILFTIPGILYVINYFLIKCLFPLAEKRISKELNITIFIKNLVLQFLGILDSFFGPSSLLKLYYSSISIGYFSIAIALIILIFFWRILKYKYINSPISFINFNLQKDLIIGSISVLIFSLIIFSLTGLYVPSPFNLGNRSLVYGSLIISVLLASISINRINLVFIWFLFVLPVFGISDHWKDWNNRQIYIIKNIRNNKEFRLLNNNDCIAITGNIYNKLGPFSHIEFFSMPWVVDSIFQDATGLTNVFAISQSISVEGNMFIDKKFERQFICSHNIYFYDTDQNILKLGTISDANALINNRPKEIRHWIQFVKGTFVESIIVVLSPRLSVLFK